MGSTSRFVVGDLILDRYMVLDQFSGTMGVAHLVDDIRRPHDATTPPRMIAKTLHPDLEENPEFVDQFLDEASVWINLTPKANVVQAYQVEIVNGVPFVFAEFIRRGILPNTLAEWIHYKLTPIEIALHFMVQILDGLWYAYQSDVELHGDLKPGNILVSEDLVIKINDWGFARAMHRPLTAAQAERYAGYHRHSDYMAPEAATSRPMVTRALDGFAVGVLLGEMVTGERLRAGTGRETIERKLQAACFGLASSVYSALAEVLSQLLTPAARRRTDFYERHARRIAEISIEVTGINVIDDSAALIIEMLPEGHDERMRSSAATIESMRGEPGKK